MVVRAQQLASWMWVAGLLGAAGCGRRSGVPANADVASTSDVGAAEDASPDTEAGDERDVGPAPFDGEWQAVTDIPNCSGLWVSKRPTTEFVNTWASCSSGRPGCDRLITSWSSAPGEKVFPGGIWRSSADAAAFAYFRAFPLPDDSASRFIHVVQLPVDRTVFALGTDSRVDPSLRCSAAVNVAPNGVVLLGGKQESPNDYWLIRIPFDASAPRDAFRLEASALVDTPGKISDLAAGESRLFFQTFQPSSVAVVDIATHAVLRRVTGESTKLSALSVVRGGAVAALLAPFGVGYVDESGAVTRLYTAPAPREIVTLRTDRSSDEIVWIEGAYIPRDGGALALGDLSLHAAPLAKNAADFRPRRVTFFDSEAVPLGQSALMAQRGYALIKINPFEMRLVRLTDGAGWSLAPEPEDRWVGSGYVDNQQVWLAVGERGYTGAAPPIRTFVRLTIEALGPPNVTPR